jgi:hypothetical protein
MPRPGNAAAPPSPKPFPYTASGPSAQYGFTASGPSAMPQRTAPTSPSSYPFTASGPGAMPQQAPWIGMSGPKPNSYPSNPYPGLVPQLVPLIQHLAQTIPFTQLAHAIVGPILAGTYNQPANQAPGQSFSFSPPSGFLPNSAPAGGGYVSSPSTFGGVAYISGPPGNQIATNSQGATIRLS